MIKEIGSYYSLSFNINYKNILNNIICFYKHFFFISGRVGIKYITNNLSVTKYLLPNYLCESIIQNFNEKNYDFYKIDNNLQINYDFLKKKIEKNIYQCIFIINYFGIIDDNIYKIIELCKNNKIIIIQDNTHNLYDKYYYSDIIISSFRKILPSPFGCIIIDTNNILPKQPNGISLMIIYINLLKIMGMILKKIFFLKIFWYDLLCECENKIDLIYDYNFDYINFIFFILYYNLNNVNIRYKNITILKDLCKYNSFNKEKTYFTYPIIFKSKQEKELIKNKLIQNQIFPMIHWPLNFDKNKKCNNYISDRILSIPIDERYNSDDMIKISKIINNYFEYTV